MYWLALPKRQTEFSSVDYSSSSSPGINTSLSKLPRMSEARSSFQTPEPSSSLTSALVQQQTNNTTKMIRRVNTKTILKNQEKDFIQLAINLAKAHNYLSRISPGFNSSKMSLPSITWAKREYRLFIRWIAGLASLSVTERVRSGGHQKKLLDAPSPTPSPIECIMPMDPYWWSWSDNHQRDRKQKGEKEKQ